jgi:hypothetical protein
VAATEGEVVTMEREQQIQRMINELYYEWDVPVEVSAGPCKLWVRGLITLDEFAEAVEVDDAVMWQVVERSGGGVHITVGE